MKRTISPLLLVVLVVGTVETSWAISPGGGGVRVGRRSGPGGSSSGISTGGGGGAAEDPAVTRQRIIDSCQKKIEEIQSLIRQEKFGTARVKLDAAWASCITTDLQKQLGDLKVKLEEIALKLLKQTDQLYHKGQYAQAVESYERLNRLFATLQAGAMARQSIAAAQRDPACQAALEEHQAQIIDDRIQRIIDTHNKLKKTTAPPPTVKPKPTVAQPKPSPVEKTNPPKNPGETQVDTSLVKPNGKTTAQTPSPVVTGTLLRMPTRSESIREMSPERQVQTMKYMLQIVEKYPGTLVGQQVAKDLQQLGSDKELMEKIQSFEKKKKVRQLLGKAEMFHKSNMVKPALNAYQQILEQFPNTPEAEIARERAAALGGKLAPPGE